jgi:serine/threonine protein kinase
MGSGVSSPGSSSALPLSFRTLSKERYSSKASFELPPKHPLSTSTSLFSRFRNPKLSEYVIGSIIGSGGFGKIREIERRRDGRWFALKSFEYSTMTLRDAETFVNELLALNRIPSYPYIIQLYAAFRDKSAVSYVMELLPGGDLRLLLRVGATITEKMISYVIASIGLALHHVHSHGMIHRDLKPENIMFSADGVPKLIDFGISFIVPTDSRACVCQGKSGTTQYIAPEGLVLHSHCHGYESDFWSLGVIMFELLYRDRPFEVHAPSSLVQYSETTYQSTWKLLRAAKGHKATHVGISETVISPTSEVAVPSLDFGSMYRFLHGDAFEEDVLPSELMVTLPDLLHTSRSQVDATTTDSTPRFTASPPASPSAPPLTPPSDNSISLLHCLLDVRIHKRYGVGENFSLFCQHPFFLSHDLDLLDPEAFMLSPSPIHPNFDQVGMHIWTRFFAENLEESLNSPLATPSSAFNEIDEYLTQVQAETPLFYETKHHHPATTTRTRVMNRSAFHFAS